MVLFGKVGRFNKPPCYTSYQGEVLETSLLDHDHVLLCYLPLEYNLRLDYHACER